MEYVKSILQRAWDINADDMEYMEVGSPELEEAFKKQKEIEEVMEALDRGKENSQTFDVTEALDKILDKHEKNLDEIDFDQQFTIDWPDFSDECYGMCGA